MARFVLSEQSYVVADGQPVRADSLTAGQKLATHALDGEANAVYVQSVTQERHEMLLLSARGVVEVTLPQDACVLTNQGAVRAGAAAQMYAAYPKRLCLPHASPCPPCSIEVAQMLAWQIAEGWEQTGGNALSVVQKDPRPLHVMAATMEGILVEIGCDRIPKVHVYPSRPGASMLRLQSRRYREHITERYGYLWGQRSANKCIPNAIFEADNQVVAAFIFAYIAADGHVTERSVEIMTASQVMAVQLKPLLHRLGVVSSIERTWRTATNGSSITRPYYRLAIGREGSCHLREWGSIPVDYKEKRLQSMAASQRSTQSGTGVPILDIFPAIYELTGQAKGLGGGSEHWNGRKQTMNSASAQAVLVQLDSILDGTFCEKKVSVAGPRFVKHYQRVAQRLEQIDHALLRQMRDTLDDRLHGAYQYHRLTDCEPARPLVQPAVSILVDAPEDTLLMLEDGCVVASW